MIRLHVECTFYKRCKGDYNAFIFEFSMRISEYYQQGHWNSIIVTMKLLQEPVGLTEEGVTEGFYSISFISQRNCLLYVGQLQWRGSEKYTTFVKLIHTWLVQIEQ